MNKYAIVACAFVATNASANPVYTSSNPSAWKLENYVGGGVAVWNTGSTCSGSLSFSATATTVEINRFWATVLMAKTTGKRIFVRYEDSSGGGCPILSFGFDSE